MEPEYLQANLRLLCSYVGSAAECSRKIGINRQQFSKYINGYSQPSMKSLRKICDYFGVDSDEIYLAMYELATAGDNPNCCPAMLIL